MAAYSVKNAKHATLVAATVDTITFTPNDPFRLFVLHNRGTTDPIYFTIDDSTPTSGGDDTFVIPPETAKIIEGVPTKKVKLISAGAMAYSVEGH